MSACTRIRIGKGVCGTAAATLRSQLVPDVDAFPGHIVCDAASKSEIVVPLVLGDRLLGVLDIDSPFVSRFDEHDLQGLEGLVQLLISHANWPSTFITE